MFLTFEASQHNNNDNRTSLRNPKQERLNRRRRSTPRACTSCRQRKIRCDGEKPCEACRWYKKAEQCSYPGRERESHSEEISLPDYRGALKRLFPETAPENLVDLSRERLLALISKPTDGSPYIQHSQHQDSLTIATSTSVETHVSALAMERPGLESLHSIPAEQEQLDENRCASASEESEEHISDDVNALSLPARNLTSYLGVSSIQAALKVIAWLHPELNSHLSHVPKDQRQHHRRSSISAGLPPSDLQLLDAYFDNFQPFSPLLDEETCRSTFLSGRRKDNRWLALLNIILALGSITAAGVDNHNHRTYFERSMSFLNFKILGNPSLEVVQTLGLMGGWYCHYISQPNLGYALMGASLRMAVTLGLQREPPFDSHMSAGVSPARSGYQEFKRRVWWSLCCLETWGHETLGRPSMDFFRPSITVKLPHLLDNENYIKVLPLIENVQFIKIASKIQESLAALPTLTHTELLNLDSQLLQWWNNLPPVLKDYTPCPEALYAARTVMRWRFYNQRMLLYRPRLLNYAMRRIPLIAIKDEERVAVQRCREIAEVAIEDISTTTTAMKMNQMIAWNAVWLVFQATMVPLIYLSVAAVADKQRDDGDDVETCKAQVRRSISTLDRMRPYGHTAKRSSGMISRILEIILRTPDTGVRASVLETHNNAGNTEPQNYPPFLTNHQPIARERVLDWTATTAATTGATNNTSFENYSSQHLWEYLSWGENNDFWAELYTSLNPQEEANFFDARIQ
ncbi:hypothetical protein EYB25_008169 [Talaromyces marneffei]|uniref:Regulatory protein GAL4 n=1 Tax=Talaromyces marneffei PM1 TaxID=1077442 RepID=A0A093UU57_TALMA|nr:hypothetical protein EYB25_008169 [Talaromyces marneffei]